MFDMSDLEAQAKQIDQAYRTELDRVAKDDRLSAEGKIDAARTLETRRRDQVQRLQQQARDRHHQAMERAQAAQRAQRAQDIQRKRELLGDVILLRLYERKVDAADADELLAMIADASPGYEAELLKELSLATLYERTSSPTATRSDIQAWQQLQPEPAIDYELRQAGQRIDQLDLGGYRASMADKLGVNPAHVPSPF